MKKVVNITEVCSEIFAGGDAPKTHMSKMPTDEYPIPIYSNGEENEGLYGYTDIARVSQPSITISARGTIGYAAIRRTPFVPIVRLITLVPNSELINIKYLYYAVQNYQFDGSGTSIPQLTVPMLKKYAFPVCSLEEQAEIVAILENVDNLVALQKQQLQKLDELIKSRFIELFGDPVDNPNNLQSYELEGLSDIVAGITKGRKTHGEQLYSVPYMAVSNVKAGYIDWTTIKTIDATQAEIEQYRLQPYDVLMTEGGDPDKLGRGAMIIDPPDNCIHQNHIFRVRVNRKVLLPQYLEAYLQQPKAKQYFFRCAKQTTGIASINMKQLRALPVLLPSIDLQNKFAAFVAHSDKLKLEVKNSLEKLETLKKSLMQEYFG